MPLKQEIESHRLHRLHTDTAVCDNSKNFDVFKNKFQDDSIKILDIYKTFNSNDKRFYESGDTHWNDLGVKIVFSENNGFTVFQNFLLGIYFYYQIKETYQTKSN